MSGFSWCGRSNTRGAESATGVRERATKAAVARSVAGTAFARLTSNDARETFGVGPRIAVSSGLPFNSAIIMPTARAAPVAAGIAATAETAAAATEPAMMLKARAAAEFAPLFKRPPAGHDGDNRAVAWVPHNTRRLAPGSATELQIIFSQWREPVEPLACVSRHIRTSRQ